MQKTLILLLLLYSFHASSQRTYHFDQKYEYEITFHSIPVPEHLKYSSSKSNTAKIFYYLNSKSRDFHAFITETDTNECRMVFADYKGLFFDVFFAKNDLNVAEYIDLNCKYAIRYGKPKKTLKFDYFKISDTMINSHTFARYKLGPLHKPRFIKRKKIGSLIYIIDESKGAELPFLNFNKADLEHKIDGLFPNGLIVEKHFIDYEGKLGWVEKLVNQESIDKKVVVPDDCDYVKYPTPNKIYLYVRSY